MYGIDWAIPEPKRRGRPKGSKNKHPRKTKKSNSAIGNPNGRPKGCGQTPESRTKISDTHAENGWRRRAPNKGSAAMQSSSGSGDSADYSMSDSGRIYPRFDPYNRGWE